MSTGELYLWLGNQFNQLHTEHTIIMGRINDVDEKCRRLEILLNNHDDYVRKAFRQINNKLDHITLILQPPTIEARFDPPVLK